MTTLPLTAAQPAEAVTDSSGNVFVDLGFAPEEATLLAMRAQLMGDLRETLAQSTQPDGSIDDFVGLLAGCSAKVASIEEINEASGWAAKPL